MQKSMLADLYEDEEALNMVEEASSMVMDSYEEDLGFHLDLRQLIKGAVEHDDEYMIGNLVGIVNMHKGVLDRLEESRRLSKETNK